MSHSRENIKILILFVFCITKMVEVVEYKKTARISPDGQLEIVGFPKLTLCWFLIIASVCRHERMAYAP